MKTAAQMIVNPALGHLHESVSHHFKVTFALRLIKVAQEKFVDAGIGKFRRLAQAAMIRVIGTGNFLRAVADNSGRKISLRWVRLRHVPESDKEWGHAFLDVGGEFS